VLPASRTRSEVCAKMPHHLSATGSEHSTYPRTVEAFPVEPEPNSPIRFRVQAEVPAELSPAWRLRQIQRKFVVRLIKVEQPTAAIPATR
jgi:hypothetical protein